MAHRTRSRCHVGTFLYVRREVTSNMMIAHCPWMLRTQGLGRGALSRSGKSPGSGSTRRGRVRHLIGFAWSSSRRGVREVDGEARAH